MSNKEDKEMAEFRKALEKTTSTDFDGHTEFYKLTAREKLEWLSQLIYFKHMKSKKTD